LIIGRSLLGIPVSEQADCVSIEKMWQVLEEFGIKRQTVQKVLPSSVTLFELYSAIKNIENG